MWKHKTKWLVRGGRKVRCYLCGKKILAEGDLFLFHGDTGYYSHQSCQAESTTISGNERRRAVKKIAVGAAVVGAIAAGAGKLIDISSQSKGSNSPAAQTILTSQGLIPPALTSDPSNPVPGQMWYRSDAGVMAHFDAVQNRVVYSSEIYDGNVNVTSKGIVNGLSVLPNDGKGGFGPDTTKGATAPGQYGSPYTETVGILEAVRYSYGSENSPQTPIKLTAGHFVISPNATLYKVNSAAFLTGAPEYAIIPVPTQIVNTTEIQNIVIHGSGQLINSGGQVVGTPLINFDSMTIIDVSQVVAPVGETVMTFAWDRSVNTNGTNAIDIRDFAVYQATPAASGDNIVGGCDFHTSWNSIALNICIYSPNNFYSTVFPSSDEIGFIMDAEDSNVCWIDALSVYCNYYGALIGPNAHVGSYVSQSNYVGLFPYTHLGVDIATYNTQGCVYNIYQTPSVFGSVRIFLLNGSDYSGGAGSPNETIADVYVESGSYGFYPAIEIENFHMEYNNSSPNIGPRLPLIQNNGTGYYVTVNNIESRTSSTAGTTAGTVQPYIIEYRTNYKKMIFQFSGYENDSTTNQTIGYPKNNPPLSNSLNFSSYAAISLNTTGLTISVSTTGITITAPDSTTTYSGIVIIEGY